MKKPRRIRLLVHNVRSLWNVGSFFRTCDAFEVEQLILTGYTAIPPRKEIAKTAIGADKTIPWIHEKDPMAALRRAKDEGFSVLSLERNATSEPLSAYVPRGDILLIAGNELTGVPDEVLKESDKVLEIPMLGKKESLNVAVAAGIALHHLRHF